MEQRKTLRIKTISEFHRLRGSSQPEHPLISIVNYAEIQRPADICETNWIFDFYQISIKRGMNAKFRYGQKSNHQILERLEKVLTDYFNNSELILNGLPTVEFIAGTLNISAKYLGSLLKLLTGQSTQQHIHDKLIEKAKEKLSTTNLTVSEIAYELGFEHPQSFSKLFKAKAKLSPLQFRTSFK